MSKYLSAATFECEIIFWLRALFPSPPDAKDFVRFFPDVSIPELIKCIADLIDRQLVSKAALRYEDGDAYLSFQGLVLTDALMLSSLKEDVPGRVIFSRLVDRPFTFCGLCLFY